MMDMGDPLMLLIGIMVSTIAGCAAGFVLGVSMGRTHPATPLPTSIRLARETLASTGSRLEKASARLSDAHRGDLAGTALVLGKRVSELSSDLGRIERKAARAKGESA